jgi:hypothetical protein
LAWTLTRGRSSHRLTTNDVDDASQLDPLLDQVEGPVASFTGDGAYDQDHVYRTVIDCDPDAAVVVPPRATAVLSEMGETEPTQRDRHLQCIAEMARMGWQTASGYNKRRRVETAIGRYKQVIGDGLRFRTDGRRATEVGVAVLVLNRMLEFGRPISRPDQMNSDGAAFAATFSSIQATAPRTVQPDPGDTVLWRTPHGGDVALGPATDHCQYYQRMPHCLET